ncbi:uncharacterized protein F4822DRAFT_422679 [Hypoxylon trugodes]|uniref:uncharacterized protein n=1 Tax=Hypoxylon trugodes TaxID=326681 RepID=UPI00218F4030|nr:uncharacterized protein F4822DRAFT_422679 [Hypoxylon trugodes]KAI1382810.1 hypothetical protein F4822DRAFT_422679 [Hypoxylon trugodes]
MNKMDPGTIISIVQLSLSGVELVTKVVREFFGGNDKVPDKLKRLRDRLTQFHNAVEDVKQSTENNASSSRAYRGADSVIETLTECNDFLRQYASALSADRTPLGATQRVYLLVGPESVRIEDFDKRIMNHYVELQYWKTGRLETAVENLRTSINEMNEINQLAFRTRHSYSHPHRAHGSPRLPDSPGVFSDEFLHEPSTSRDVAQPGFPRSPKINPSPVNPSLPSIDELPSPQLISSSLPDVGSHGLPRRTGPVLTYLRRGTDSTLVEEEEPINSGAQAQIPTSPSQFRTPGYSVLLRIDSHQYQFSTTGYRIFNVLNSRVIEWHNPHSTITVLHYVHGNSSIPHTIPEDKRSRVFFLPKDVKHNFKVTKADGQPQTISGKPEYEFYRKADREVFQKNIRDCESLEMIRALKMHSAADNNIAIKFHLKVWRKNSLNDKPTFSFAAHEIGQPNHQVEFLIRWFKKTPELKGDHKLILKVYSGEPDPETEPETDATKRRLSFRRQSLNSTQTSTSRSSSRQRSSSARAPLPTLYEFQGIEPPGDVRKLGHLEIEFLTQELRKAFIKACYEAHRPAWEALRRDGTPSPVSQRSSYSRPPSWTLGPNQGPYELESSNIHEMEDSGRHELMGEPVFRIPSPSMSFTTPHFAEEVQFNTQSLFTPAREFKHERDPSPAATEDYDRGPYSREPG